MSRLLSCNTLAAGVPLLTENAGKMSDGMDLDAMIAVAQLHIIRRRAHIPNLVRDALACDLILHLMSQASRAKIANLQSQLSGAEASAPPKLERGASGLSVSGA